MRHASEVKAGQVSHLSRSIDIESVDCCEVRDLIVESECAMLHHKNIRDTQKKRIMFYYQMLKLRLDSYVSNFVITLLVKSLKLSINLNICQNKQNTRFFKYNCFNGLQICIFVFNLYTFPSKFLQHQLFTKTSQ